MPSLEELEKAYGNVTLVTKHIGNQYYQYGVVWDKKKKKQVWKYIGKVIDADRLRLCETLERVLPYLIFPPMKFRNEIADLTKGLYKSWRGESTETFERLCSQIDDVLEKRKKFDNDRENCISKLGREMLVKIARRRGSGSE